MEDATYTSSPIVFKPIPGFSKYRADSEGFLWSCRAHQKSPEGVWRKLNPKASKKSAYLHVSLVGDDGKTLDRCVHYFILIAFVGPRPQGMECCHFPDPDPTNNRPDNLRWDTRQENQADAAIHRAQRLAEKHKLPTHLNEKLDIVRLLVNQCVPTIGIALELGITEQEARKLARHLKKIGR
jgi:hypothetical protein